MDSGQQVLRVTNEEIRPVSADVGLDDGEFVCECGAEDCDEVIRLTGRGVRHLLRHSERDTSGCPKPSLTQRRIGQIVP